MLIMKTARIIAIFHPQAWINDYAYAVDPEGDTRFDVTDTVIELGKELALEIEDDRQESDNLRFSPNAPEWIRNWSGPFYVEVAEAIQEYFDSGSLSDSSA
jgi:hypothetical protein